MQYSGNKDIASIVRRLVRHGWQFSRGNRHDKLKAPDGRLVIVPCTPSDSRAVHNFMADIRRHHVSY